MHNINVFPDNEKSILGSVRFSLMMSLLMTSFPLMHLISGNKQCKER